MKVTAVVDDFMAFIATRDIFLEYMISGAIVSRLWTSYFTTPCNKNSNDFRIIIYHVNPNYGRLDPITVCICIAICISTVFSTKDSSHFNYIVSIMA